MLLREFQSLTGFHPSAALYSEIEKVYNNFDGDKFDFCRAYVENADGIADRIAMACDVADGKTIKAFRDEITRLEDKVRSVTAALDRELEWAPWEDNNSISQDDYDSLKRSGHPMTDHEAVEFLHDELGFSADLIRIKRTVPKYEINRHHYLRKVGEIARDPYYDATDYHYIRFTVKCREYELRDDELHLV